MAKRIQRFAIGLVSAVLAGIPNFILEFLVRVLTQCAYMFATKDKEKLFYNISLVYGLPKHSVFARTFAKQVFAHQIWILIECLTLSVLPKKHNEIRCEGFEEFKDFICNEKAKGDGVIVVTAHLGNWEYVAKYSALATGQTFHALAKPSKSDVLTEFLDRSRSMQNTRVLWTDRKSILKDMLSVLKSGQVLGFVMDQKPEGRRGPIVEFLGQDTEFVTGPEKLSGKTNSPIIAVYCLRLGLWHYRLVYEKIEHSSVNETSSGHELTQKMRKFTVNFAC